MLQEEGCAWLNKGGVERKQIKKEAGRAFSEPRGKGDPRGTVFATRAALSFTGSILFWTTLGTCSAPLQTQCCAVFEPLPLSPSSSFASSVGKLKQKLGFSSFLP